MGVHRRDPVAKQSSRNKWRKERRGETYRQEGAGVTERVISELATERVTHWPQMQQQHRTPCKVTMSVKQRDWRENV